MRSKSFKNDNNSLQIAFIQATNVEGLTNEEKKWAQNQFKFLYAQQMTKLSFQLERNKKVQTNLDNINKNQKQQCEQTFSKLKIKMEINDKKKQQRDNQKLKLYKLQEQKWNRKMQSIESKMKSQNRQAIRKAEKYRQDSQKYWQKKQNQIKNSRVTSYDKYKINKTQNDIKTNNKSNKMLLSDKQQSKNSKYLQFKMSQFFKMNDKQLGQYPKTSRASLKSNQTLQIQEEIRKRKEKKLQIQKQREEIVFQNALKKLAKIKQRRKIVQKLKQKQKSPTKVLKPKINNEEDQQYHSNKRSINRRSSSQILNKSKSNDLLNESILAHIQAKKKIEQEQFKERDKIIEYSKKKERKNQIMRNIKQKIKELKSSALKLQTFN